jgi:hypothetical protein
MNQKTAELAARKAEKITVELAESVFVFSV